MRVLHDAFRSPDLPYGCIATIGNYDGLHRGQRAVIDRVVARAKERAVESLVISFEPHPLTVLRPEAAPKLLTTPIQRERLLAEAGVDALALIRFDRDFARTTAEQFVRQFLHQRLAVEEVYVGLGFEFGQARQGNLELLQRLGASLGFGAFGVEHLVAQGEVVSSSRIRRLVGEGKVELAAELLGRPYGLYGKIVRGDRMGMRLGWPTINLLPENDILPADGVYAGRAFFPSFPATFDCVTNVGTRPTVYENHQRVVESHVLGFSSDVYGEVVEVQFCKRLREERLFSSVMDLSAQIARDVETAREYFSARKRLEERVG
jgi:riboflavin kinase/FMN adenylyltransferase